MGKIILCCSVLSDGTGDFQHLLDIYEFLLQHDKTKTYEYVLVITYQFNEFLPLIKEKLGKFNIPDTHLYLSQGSESKEYFLSKERLLKHLQESDQIIQISYDYSDFSRKGVFGKYMNPKAVVKFIGEHERRETFISGPLCTSLGLGKLCYGIKLSPKEKITPLDALAIFKTNDPDFYNALLHQTNSATADDFIQTHQLIPAYFNEILPCNRFLLFLCINDHMSLDKDIVIYMSGRAVKTMLNHNDLFFSEELFQRSHIKEIKFSEGTEAAVSKTIIVNPQGQKILYLMTGHKVSDISFGTLFQQANLAGVSGDNSFEMSLSTCCLPYYHSTNAGSKKETLIQLKNIIENKIDLDENVKKDFIKYFDNLYNWNRYGSLKLAEEVVVFRSLNLPEMFKAMPTILHHLLQHYNFYSQLSTIISSDKLLTQADVRASEELMANADTYEKTPNVTPKFITIDEDDDIYDSGMPAQTHAASAAQSGMFANKDQDDKSAAAAGSSDERPGHSPN